MAGGEPTPDGDFYAQRSSINVIDQGEVPGVLRLRPAHLLPTLPELAPILVPMTIPRAPEHRSVLPVPVIGR